MMMEDEDPATGSDVTLDPYVERELLATIEGLGGSIESVDSALYVKGEDCLGTLLIPFFRCLFFVVV